MLTTDNYLNLKEYTFKNSPESCSDNSYYADLPSSDEDFLQQLSSDLDIPLLLNAGEDEMSLLNSFFDKSPDEILSEIELPSLPDIEDQFNELQQFDFGSWSPNAFPNLVKSEPDSDFTHSPCQTNLDITDEVKTEPLSPKCGQVKVERISPLKRPIQPKTVPPQKNILLIKNPPNLAPSPKVVVLENIVQTPIPIQPQAVNVNPFTTTTMIVNGDLNNLNSLDPKALKRQQRKIKNRESACLSRKKKKDYLTALEYKVKELSFENQKLKMLNLQLKEKLLKYEGNIKNTAKNVKSSLVLCAFLLVIGVNLNLIRNPFVQQKEVNVIEDNLSKSANHHGRSLLWTDEKSAKNNSNDFLAFSMCPATINQSEATRLVLELEKWIGKPVKPNNFPLNVTNIPKIKSYRMRKMLRKRKIEANSITPSLYSIQNFKNNDSKEIQVFSSHESTYTDFFEAINRQSDTFYVVSLSDHHMLLPALYNNKTRRPKMSLIMPSMLPSNDEGDSSNPKLVPLMQIDCEVLDTRLIKIHYGSIPQHLRTDITNSTHQPMNDAKSSRIRNVNKKTQGNYTTNKPYKPYFINNNEDYYNIN